MRAATSFVKAHSSTRRRQTRRVNQRWHLGMGGVWLVLMAAKHVHSSLILAFFMASLSLVLHVALCGAGTEDAQRPRRVDWASSLLLAANPFFVEAFCSDVRLAGVLVAVTLHAAFSARAVHFSQTVFRILSVAVLALAYARGHHVPVACLFLPWYRDTRALFIAVGLGIGIGVAALVGSHAAAADLVSSAEIARATLPSTGLTFLLRFVHGRPVRRFVGLFSLFQGEARMWTYALLGVSLEMMLAGPSTFICSVGSIYFCLWLGTFTRDAVRSLR